MPEVETTITRVERKARTRRAILDAALSLSAEGGLTTLSLRNLAREVGVVPTAFYRHFGSVEELGLALVEESFGSLREVLRDARRTTPEPGEVINRSVELLRDHVLERREHFGFLTRESVIGPGAVRAAVRHQLELFERELATDLARIHELRTWSTEDLNVLANMIVALMFATTDELLVASASHVDAVTRRAERQLRMLIVGIGQWRSKH